VKVRQGLLCVRDLVRLIVSLVPMLCALTGFAAIPIGSRLLFPGGTVVPRSVQEFAWRVIETRCNYQADERERRLFWAYGVRTSRIGADVVYSINILSDLPWMRADPPAIIEMTVVDDGRLRLTALRSSFVACAPSLERGDS
jgi:hypothetical protein